MTAPGTIEAAGFVAVRHYTGARHTRTTYSGRFTLDAGATVERCGHDGHRTPDAALTCAAKAGRLAKAAR